MSQLPKEWVQVKLKDVVDKIVGGGTPSKSVPSYYEGEIPWMTVKDMNKTYLTDTIDHITQEAVENSSTNVIPAGIPIIATRMSLGKIVRASFDSAINQDLKALFVNKEIDQYFFEYWYRSQGIKIESLGTGTTVKGVRLEVINGLDFPLAPLAEQQRIVEKLDEVLAQVDTIKARLDGIPAIIKRFRQSVLAAAVSGKLTEEWRSSSEYREVFGKLLPSSWKVKAAKDICVKVQSGSTPRNDPFNQGGTIPFLKVYNIVNQQINFDYKPQFVTTDTHHDKLKRSVAYPGDVLMNIVGPPLGKVAILTSQYPEWNLNQAITLFRADSELLDNKYLYYVLCEGDLVRAVMPETKGSVGQVNISLTQCRESSIPLPAIEEQKEIVRLVDQYFAFADTIEAQVKKVQARVDNLTQSILAKAFRGELVPQDPDDEPADKLLERIAEARKEAEALAKAAKKAEAAKKRAAKKATA
ncbi:restriction endonuclease subunit S [Photobacterium sp. J15]|uniref:restriction endonuclease subunit S n=1 Tax=Photobacterium sp. J15 TaxID=265901 RepID=UPI0007E36B5C|nr:restriction endonuclease subunit S [Photobacterium sp. J15]